MVTDPIADLAARLKNAILRRYDQVVLPFNKTAQAVAQVLVSEGYLAGLKVDKTSGRSELLLKLSYNKGVPAITQIRRISKSGVRHYVSCRKLPRVLGGMGTLVVSTPKGIVSGRVAAKEHVGGEVLCEVW
jgi:small subunit ribosomal protein S8